MKSGFQIPRHTYGNWQVKQTYTSKYSFAVPGHNPVLNSCSTTYTTLQCSGHGTCQEWFDTLLSQQGGTSGGAVTSRLSFCKCSTYWADPECKTQRKSQLIAYFLSMFLGFFGADQYYLGYWLLGTLKLLTLGGFGAWWLFDLVRIGSSPVVSAHQFRVAPDLNHAAFVMTLLLLMGGIGLYISIWSIKKARNSKAREIMILQAETPEENLALGPGLYGRDTQFHGYGSTLENGAKSIET